MLNAKGQRLNGNNQQLPLLGPRSLWRHLETGFLGDYAVRWHNSFNNQKLIWERAVKHA
jgi:hypothetical protein